MNGSRTFAIEPFPATGQRPLSAELSLPQALASPAANGPGIYTLRKQGKPFYVGRASNLRRRLQEHLLCLTRMGISPVGYSVDLRPLSEAQLKAQERAAIRKWGLRSQGGLLTNRKARELELAPDAEGAAPHGRSCGCRRCQDEAASFEFAPPRRQPGGSWRRRGRVILVYDA